MLSSAGFKRQSRRRWKSSESTREIKSVISLQTLLLPSSEKARSEFMADLASKGIQPTNVIDTKNGQRVEKIIFPGVTISYGGMETGVMLLKGNKAGTPAEENQPVY